MPFNGSGVFSYNASTVNPAVSGTTIASADFNTLTTETETGLSTCIAKDGQTTITANLPMATYKHTGVGASADLTDYVRVQEMQDNTHLWGGTAGGTADAQTVTLSPAINALATGQRFSFKPVADNTGACTINVNGKGATDVKLNDGSDPYAGALDATGISECLYDGTNYILLNPATVTGTWTPVLSDGTNNATPGTPVTGKYTRTGNTVMIQGRLTTSSLGSVSGNLRINGLPFTPSSDSNSQAPMSISLASGLAVTAGVSVSGYVEVGASHIRLQIWNSTTGTANMQETHWTDDGSACFSGTYFID